MKSVRIGSKLYDLMREERARYHERREKATEARAARHRHEKALAELHVEQAKREARARR